ncbi:MAG: crotonobetainyl-CoA:carnitine CoA-transferase CaiB-like acyl-CoA transferase [Bermanella sp.]|jgi:crotonobetainyl-CoA:carnitine CoA-transferase CaiB-like acyl-CoA transferase
MNTEYSDNAAATPKPFEGLLVVSIEQAVAAPLCSCHLAEGGARVIKIEREEGDFARNYDKSVKGESAYFVWANHGKESLKLNFKEPEDAQLLDRLLSKADVFVQNLAPGAMERSGLGSSSLREKYPRLITCDISGYGTHGVYRDMKAYDFLVQCESGLVSINGSPDAYGRIGVSVCDIGAGMNAIIGIQNALLVRAQTGIGSGVSVSLFATAADWMSVPYLQSVYADAAPKRVGLHHPSIAPYGGYTTSDQEVVVISIQNEREWGRFCDQVLSAPELVSRPEFGSVAARVENRLELDRQINAVFSTHTRFEMVDLLQQASIAFGALNSVKSFSVHPQLKRREVTLQSGQTAQIVAPPIEHSFDDASATFGRVPGIGEHSDAIRAEFDQTLNKAAV